MAFLRPILGVPGSASDVVRALYDLVRMLRSVLSALAAGWFRSSDGKALSRAASVQK
jgi:hypothetical protein